MRSIFEILRFGVVVNIHSKEKTRLINLCRLRSIDIWDVKEIAGGITLTFINQDLDKFDKLMKASFIDYSVLRYKGMGRIALFVKRHNKIALTLLFLVVILLYLNTFVFFVNISCEDAALIKDARIYLSSEGVRDGMKKNSFSNDEIKMMLFKKYSSIVDVNVAFEGSKLYIDMITSKNMDNGEDGELYSEETPVNVVAAFDGKIDEIEVYTGTILKRKGDSVKKGDIIIKGVSSYEDYNDKTVAYLCHAKGKVISYVSVLYDNIHVYKYTPMTTTKAKIYKRYNIFSSSFGIGESESEDYVKVSSSVSEKNILGLIDYSVTEDRYCEKNLCKVKTLDEIKKEAYNSIKEKLDKTQTPFKIEYTVNDTPYDSYVNVYVYYKKSIGVDAPIKEKDKMLKEYNK